MPSDNCLQKSKSTMSYTDVPGGARLLRGGGKRFKGIENFLKRVAFNLGNTPSQTEVKIISCIPIDVSDLQQKIILLEKELEESRVSNARASSSQKRVVNAVLCDRKFPAVSNAGISCNPVNIERSKPCEACTNMSSRKKSTVSLIVASGQECDVNSYPSSRQEQRPYTAEDRRYAEIMCYEDNVLPTSVGELKRQGRKNFFKKKKKSLRHKKPKSHYVYYAQTSNSPFNKSDIADEGLRGRRGMSRSYLAEMINKQYKPQPLGSHLSDISKFSSPVCRDTYDYSVGCAYESDICSCCHGTFQNIDDDLKCNNPHLHRDDNVTPESEFYDSTFYDVIPVKEKPVKSKRTLDITKKREHKPSIDIMCWPEDVRTKLRTHPMYNPLYFNYHAVVSNTDRNLRMPKVNRREPTPLKVSGHHNNMDRQITMEMSKSSCIDFGDVYPKLVKKRIKLDKHLQADKCLTAVRAPCKVDAECLTTNTNNSECQTVTSTVDIRESVPSSDDKTEETLNQIKTILQSVLHEVKVGGVTKSGPDEKPKKDAIVQKGISQGNMPGLPLSGALGSLQGTVPDALQGTMRGPTQGNIQGILQGNMPENVQNNIPENMPGNLQANLRGSQILNSFTYSPYNMAPYMPSCSKQINSGQYYYPPNPMKCFQNFPLFIQNPGRHTCASCFRHSSHLKSHYGRQAATIATNTDAIKVEHSKETEKLIKEIYKSMALTMGVVQKQNSSEYEPVHDLVKHIEKSTRTMVTKPPQPVKEFKKVTNVVQAVSELFRKKDMAVSSESQYITESKFGSRVATDSRYGSHNTSTTIETNRPQLLGTRTTDVDMKLRKERMEKFLNQAKQGLPEEMRQNKRRFHTGIQNNITTISSSETSSSETETDATIVPPQTKQITQKERKEKKSLFSKMFRSVKLFKPRERKKRDKKEKVEEPESEESSSDSDDYQTIYSQKIETTPKHRPRAYNLPKRRTHSKISYKHMYQRDRSPEKFMRRSPYMEQEYRRYWNEKLMFQENKHPRHSSVHRYSTGHSSEAPQRATPYYKTYETRTAFVEPRKPLARIEGVNARRLVVPKQAKNPSTKIDPKLPAKGVAWLKKNKMGLRCGEQWKQLIVEGC